MRTSSYFQAHVRLELRQMTFEGFHFLMKVHGFLSHFFVIRHVRDALGKTPDDGYAVAEIVGGLHEDGFLPAAGSHELPDKLGPSRDGADELSYHLQYSKFSAEIGTPSCPESTIRAPIFLVSCVRGSMYARGMMDLILIGSARLWV